MTALVLFYFGTTRAKATFPLWFIYFTRRVMNRRRELFREWLKQNWEDEKNMQGTCPYSCFQNFLEQEAFFFLVKYSIYSPTMWKHSNFKSSQRYNLLKHWKHTTNSLCTCVRYSMSEREALTHTVAYTVSSKPAWKMLHFLSCEILNLFSSHVIVWNALMGLFC